MIITIIFFRGWKYTKCPDDPGRALDRSARRGVGDIIYYYNNVMNSAREKRTSGSRQPAARRVEEPPGLIIICWCATDVDHKYFSIIVFPAPVNNNWPRTHTKTYTHTHARACTCVPHTYTDTPMQRERQKTPVFNNDIRPTEKNYYYS